MSSRLEQIQKSLLEEDLRIETASLDDLNELTKLVMELFELQSDFQPNKKVQQHGLELILENPARGRIFVIRNDDKIIGMINTLFTISTAEGSFVVMMEDVVIHPDHRGQGYGSHLLEYVIEFSKEKGFKRITLLTDRVSKDSQKFFIKHKFVHSGLTPMRHYIL